MSLYTAGIIFILIGTLLHAGANVVDNYLSDTLYRHLTGLIFFCSAINLIMLPLVFFTKFSPGVQILPLFLLLIISVINVTYPYLYYQALRQIDTSIVSSLFSLGKIVTPLFAFFLVKERLHAIQYAGFFLIIISSILLTLDFKRVRLQSAFLLMLFVSVVLTVQSILFKRLYQEGMTWGASVFWATILDFIVSGIIFLTKSGEIKNSVDSLKGRVGVLFLNQVCTWGGELAGLYSLTLIPVSVFEGVSSTQPIFVLLIALSFVRSKPGYFREMLDKRTLAKKIVLFSLITLGTILMI